MMRDKQRAPLSVFDADPDQSESTSTDDEAFARELNMAKFANDNSILSSSSKARSSISSSAHSSSNNNTNNRQRRRSSNNAARSGDGDFDDSENEEPDFGFSSTTGFPSSSAGGDPFASNDAADWATDFGGPSGSFSSIKESRRSSYSGGLMSNSSQSNNMFAAEVGDASFDAFAAAPEEKQKSSRRHSTLGSSASSGSGAGFMGPTGFDEVGGGDSSLRNSKKGKDLSSSGRRHSAVGSTGGDIEINGVSEAFLFSRSNGSGHAKPMAGELQVAPRPDFVKRNSTREIKPNNPLLSIPAPFASSSHVQHNDDDDDDDHDDDDAFPTAFPGMPAMRDNDEEEGSVGEDFFDDDGTIDWDEGGAIVSKAKKYDGNASKGSLSFNDSFGKTPHRSHDSSSSNHNKGLESGLGRLNAGKKGSSSSRGTKSISSSGSGGRRRLQDLERRLGGKGGSSYDDDLTTATPSTRCSEFSGAASVVSAATCPSLRSTRRERPSGSSSRHHHSSSSSSSAQKKSSSSGCGVELKTGSLLTDLVLIMDGKMEIPEGKEGDNNGKSRSSHRDSSRGDKKERRRSSMKNESIEDNNNKNSDDDPFGDPFVVRSEVRGENMKSFAENRTKSSKDLKPSRKAPGRIKSSDAF